jgi:hypothetical protein
VGTCVAVAGQSLTADLALERTTGTQVVRAAVTNLAMVRTSGGQPVVSLTGGSGALLLIWTGMATRLTGALVLAVPGAQECPGDPALRLRSRAKALERSTIGQALAVGGVQDRGPQRVPGARVAPRESLSRSLGA